ncbi:probable RNA-dependent RNA polymerase 1 isoform X2 [Selaginella moellendorffii]|uniref:probable RNA-dependent RNA polymerase 1 isoform X2 n=1 Tax=Selaginella moellendorffii TaxID=88036 RepID=UPI000D1D083F|nr:probable RNA-dependent RNA polymerase 1 isoform X2 [Selaginella moellendorffii]|eukprot:XP_024535714.1 probable RNA-dependent RNA polymerase 1 isoform X2 [Selaginella moellendorffii]
MEMEAPESGGYVELFVRNISYQASVEQFVEFLEGVVGRESVISCELLSNDNGRSKGRAIVKLSTEHAAVVLHRAGLGLRFAGRKLVANVSNRVQHNPQHPNARAGSAKLYCGNLAEDQTVEYLWCSSQAKAEFFFSDPVKVELLVDGDYKMEIISSSIASLESCKISPENSPGLVFQLYYPPRVYKRLENSCSIFSYSRADICDDYLWARATDFTPDSALGQSVVFCLELPDSSQDELRKIIQKFNDYNLGDYPPRFRRMVLRRGQPFSVRQLAVPVLSSTCGFDLPLEVEFKVNYLIQNGHVSPAGLTREFFGLLSENTPAWCLSALSNLERCEKTCLNPASQIRNYMRTSNRRRERYLGAVAADESQIYVKRLLVTPLKVYFLGPELEESNRVTRHFSHKLDNFLRVTFVDEDFDSLNSYVLSSSRGRTKTEVYYRLLAILRLGIKLCGKDFQFLAFSASQLRENSLWMFADDDEVTGEYIRQWMGDFLSIRNVAKCAARMGQSFSTSTRTLDVPRGEVRQLSDVETFTMDGHKYCFSDGIGTISREFATRVARRCRASTVPSAFQIRYGGYKGVVAVDPASCFKLSLRPSMSKFPSEQTTLDVLEKTRYIPSYLNREIISLLSTLEVPDGVFERMQAHQVELLDRMLLDSAATYDVLRVLYAGECHKLLVSMVLAGFSPVTEPYMRSLLQAFRAAQLLSLEKKSRIFVPKGRLLMGCLDEQRVLRYGQCFVQVSPLQGVPVEEEIHCDRGVTARNQAFVVTGSVVVAKNPCLHPGDVLVLEAVDVPELHHMVDCIVFPQQGPRPHPNECSGSDLDGDQYFVSWDSALIPPKRHPPMNYEAPPAVELDHSVRLEEIQEFFVNWITSDSLGVIAHAHLALSDWSDLQARDPKCMELARLYSVAVDFPKTGVPAVMPPELRPEQYPDFMEKRNKRTYISTRVIGKLYRSIRESHRDTNTSPLVSERSFDQQYDRALVVQGYQSHLEEAKFFKECYDSKLTSILNHYKVSEAEIMSGSVRSLARYSRRRQGDAMARVVLAAKALVKEARGWFDDGGEITENEACAKAFAWYHVTYHPEARKKSDLLSFPWVVSDKLVAIKKRNSARS